MDKIKVEPWRAGGVMEFGICHEFLSMAAD